MGNGSFRNYRWYAGIAVAAMFSAEPAGGVDNRALPYRAPTPQSAVRVDTAVEPTSADAAVPVPVARPEIQGPETQEPKVNSAKEPPSVSPPNFVDPATASRSATDGQESACRARLRQLGVEFRDVPPIHSPEGCSVPHPISVSMLGKSIILEPDAVLNCQMAETAARFAQETLGEEAKAAFSSPLRRVEHASAYICRPRNGTGKLSEHAFGNALDIAAVQLEDGRRIEVARTADSTEANFLAAVRAASCGPFKTVLGPGNPDHDTHFHLDLQPRRNGATYCR